MKILTDFKANITLKLLTDFGSSQIVTGTEKLINDITNWLYVLVPLVGAAFIVYFAIRRGSADEQDKKQWDGRIKTAIVSIIIGILATTIVSLINTYYGGTAV